MKKRAIFAIGMLVMITMSASRAFAAKDVHMTNQPLLCEMRANDNYVIFLSQGLPNNFHFVLHSDQNGIKVYHESNSWGHGRRSFAATEQYNKSSPHYTILRRERVWKGNTPSVVVLNKGEFLINDINFCDGSWQVSPKLPGDAAAKLIVTPKFEIGPETSDMKTGVWTGKIEGAPKEVSLDKSCVSRLNADR